MSVTAQVNYHVKRPEQQAYIIDAGGVAGKLVSPVQDRATVSVSDMRGLENTLRFETDGLAFLRKPSRVVEFDDSGDWKGAYDCELTELLKSEVGARDVVIFDHTVRIDDPKSGRKPARNVHSDYSEAGAHQRLKDLLGQERAAEWEEGHFGFINIWRPVRHPIASAPLGFIRSQTVRHDDWIMLDLIYPDRTGQIMGLVHGQDHEWIYLSGMTPEEIAVFNIYDNKGLASIAHSAIDLVETPDTEHPRMSIESRTLVRY
ncbi:MAG: hypothetical protein JJ866_23465 [Roseibium sp.]|uniref:CmcJ/NvfI family oxidoreductase n=1 Tax=Roseibium sp. TaxID=1936156 RepID=UPI001B0EE6FC|nr:CmcJ/NvfI family oxidoreductase [Roseibium sp.]MBO6894916.1 hypothetical protein [Roseibium sp.]MBO6930806.1 hypothetical protein [Roseibium sp.]